MPESVPVDHLQPSQRLLDVTKLRAVLDWVDPDAPEVGPLPFLRPVEDLGFAPRVVDTEYVLSDGHTRAFAAYLCRSNEVTVELDPDRDDLSLGVYRTCVEWCLDAEITAPSDLTGRVVSEETYLREWVDRCQSLD